MAPTSEDEDNQIYLPTDSNHICMPCQCNGNSDLCDKNTGVCFNCQNHSDGDYCETCKDGFYRQGDECVRCSCSKMGSILEGVCDKVTGQCFCKHPEATGLDCGECPEGYFHCESHGCCECPCVSAAGPCDQDTAECTCNPGVIGQYCDTCKTGYFNLDPIDGCSKCPCDSYRNDCDPVTGECLCPPNTFGEQCEQCVRGSYNHTTGEGCTRCECDMQGTIAGSDCSSISGQCECKQGYHGTNCDECEFGYYKDHFTGRCFACNCDARGTKAEDCDPITDICTCNVDGTCNCKNNVQGEFCDTCKEGTFGLHKSNVLDGCLDCCCSNRTHSCTEGEFYFADVTAGKVEETGHQTRPFASDYQHEVFNLGRDLSLSYGGDVSVILKTPSKYFEFDVLNLPKNADMKFQVDNYRLRIVDSFGRWYIEAPLNRTNVYDQYGKETSDKNNDKDNFNFECEDVGTNSAGEIVCYDRDQYKGGANFTTQGKATGYDEDSFIRKPEIDGDNLSPEETEQNQNQNEGLDDKNTDIITDMTKYNREPIITSLTTNLKETFWNKFMIIKPDEVVPKGPVFGDGMEPDAFDEWTKNRTVPDLNIPEFNDKYFNFTCPSNKTDCPVPKNGAVEVPNQPEKPEPTPPGKPVTRQEMINILTNIGRVSIIRTLAGFPEGITHEDFRPVEKIEFKNFEIEKAIQYKTDDYQGPNDKSTGGGRTSGKTPSSTVPEQKQQPNLNYINIAEPDQNVYQIDKKYYENYQNGTFVSGETISSKHRQICTGVDDKTGKPTGCRKVPNNYIPYKGVNLPNLNQTSGYGLDGIDFTEPIFEISADIPSFQFPDERDRSDVIKTSNGQFLARPAEVEICNCNEGYTGFHCQYCQEGWTRENNRDPTSKCIPCNCNGRSSSCDRVTGICRGCSNNYIGDHCEKCPDRFYPKWLVGEASTKCTECLCPSEDFQDPNSHDGDYCESTPDAQDYICKYCLTGYGGNHCDICQPGYYGAPLKGIPCMPCNCDPAGSENQNCDSLGNCPCKNGYTGKKCSDCKNMHVRTFILDKQYGGRMDACLSCDTYCINLLFDNMKPLAAQQENFIERYTGIEYLKNIAASIRNMIEADYTNKIDTFAVQVNGREHSLKLSVEEILELAGNFTELAESSEDIFEDSVIFPDLCQTMEKRQDLIYNRKSASNLLSKMENMTSIASQFSQELKEGKSLLANYCLDNPYASPEYDIEEGIRSVDQFRDNHLESNQDDNSIEFGSGLEELSSKGPAVLNELIKFYEGRMLGIYDSVQSMLSWEPPLHANKEIANALQPVHDNLTISLEKMETLFKKLPFLETMVSNNIKDSNIIQDILDVAEEQIKIIQDANRIPEADKHIRAAVLESSEMKVLILDQLVELGNNEKDLKAAIREIYGKYPGIDSFMDKIENPGVNPTTDSIVPEIIEMPSTEANKAKHADNDNNKNVVPAELIIPTLDEIEDQSQLLQSIMNASENDMIDDDYQDYDNDADYTDMPQPWEDDSNYSNEDTYMDLIPELSNGLPDLIDSMEILNRADNSVSENKRRKKRELAMGSEIVVSSATKILERLRMMNDRMDDVSLTTNIAHEKVLELMDHNKNVIKALIEIDNLIISSADTAEQAYQTFYGDANSETTITTTTTQRSDYSISQRIADLNNQTKIKNFMENQLELQHANAINVELLAFNKTLNNYSKESKISLEIFVENYNSQMEILNLSMDLLKSKSNDIQLTGDMNKMQMDENGKLMEKDLVTKLEETVNLLYGQNKEIQEKIHSDYEKILRIKQILTSNEIEELQYGDLPFFTELLRSVDSLTRVISHTESDFDDQFSTIDELSDLGNEIDEIFSDVDKLLIDSGFIKDLPEIRSAKFDEECGARVYRNGEKIVNSDANIEFGDLQFEVGFLAEKLPARILSFGERLRLTIDEESIILGFGWGYFFYQSTFISCIIFFRKDCPTS